MEFYILAANVRTSTSIPSVLQTRAVTPGRCADFCFCGMEVKI